MEDVKKSLFLTQQDSPLNELGEFVSELKKEVDTGRMLKERGMTNDFVSTFEKTASNPFLANWVMLDHTEDNISNLLQTEIASFLNSKRQLLSKAFKTFENNSLHYTLILKDDIMGNRRVFFEFLEEYDKKSPLAERFQILFDFVPSEMEKLLDTHQEIDLNSNVES